MKVVSRGLRASTRSPIRTTLLTVLLAVSLGLSLIMLVVSNAFDAQIDQIRSEVGTDIYMRPSGSQPGEVAVMPESDVDALTGISEVAKIGKKLNIPYAGDSLKPAELSEEGKEILSGRGLEGESAQNAASNMEISIIGSNTPDALSVRGRVTTGLGVTIQPSKNVEIVEGRSFSQDEMNVNIVLLSKGLAEANGMSVGSTFDLMGTNMEVIGIFTADSGDLFGQNAIFLPLETAQRILEKPEQITEAVIWADDVDHVDGVVASISEKVSKPNLTTNKEAFDELAAPLQNAKQGSQTGMIASFAACVAIILFAMIMTVRGRMKEIGILKAIGAANNDVIFQFAVETLAVSLTAAIFAGLATYFFAGSIAGSMVGASTGYVSNVSVSPAVFGYALGIAIILSLLGSCIPAWSVARVKPAEVLRYE